MDAGMLKYSYHIHWCCSFHFRSTLWIVFLLKQNNRIFPGNKKKKTNPITFNSNADKDKHQSECEISFDAPFCSDDHQSHRGRSIIAEAEIPISHPTVVSADQNAMQLQYLLCFWLTVDLLFPPTCLNLQLRGTREHLLSLSPGTDGFDKVSGVMKLSVESKNAKLFVWIWILNTVTRPVVPNPLACEPSKWNEMCSDLRADSGLV